MRQGKSYTDFFCGCIDVYLSCNNYSQNPFIFAFHFTALLNNLFREDDEDPEKAAEAKRLARKRELAKGTSQLSNFFNPTSKVNGKDKRTTIRQPYFARAGLVHVDTFIWPLSVSPCWGRRWNFAVKTPCVPHIDVFSSNPTFLILMHFCAQIYFWCKEFCTPQSFFDLEGLSYPDL